jgi:hypothetical protein
MKIVPRIIEQPAPPLPIFEVRRSLTILCAIGLFVSFAAIYGLSSNHSYTHDAVIFATAVETPIRLLPETGIFEWNHFLWIPTGRAFYLVLHFFNVAVRGYEALELLNALVGAAGVAITFLTLARFSTRPWGPLAWSIVSGFCAVYWWRSAAAENYLLGAFWAICFCFFLVSYWREPTGEHMACMAICAVLSAFYHLGNMAMMIATVAVVVIRQFYSGFLSQILRLGLLFTILWLPYAYIHQWFEPGGFSAWWLWSKGLADGYAPSQNPSGAFDWLIVKNSGSTLQTFLKSIFWFDSWNLGTIADLAAVALLGAFATMYGRWKGSKHELAENEGRLGLVFLIPLVSVTALYAVWQPWNPIYWAVHTALLCLFAGAISFRGVAGRIFPVQGVCFALLIAVLGVHNLRAVILPEKTNPRQSIVDACLKIGQTIPVQSPVVISGRGGWAYLKVYLPYFAHRRRFAIDLFASNAVVQHRDPVAWMQDVIKTYFDQGIPVFLMDDALTNKDSFGDFGISGQQLESVWPFELRKVFEFPGNPPNKLYLVIPSPRNVPSRGQDPGAERP